MPDTGDSVQYGPKGLKIPVATRGELDANLDKLLQSPHPPSRFKKTRSVNLLRRAGEEQAEPRLSDRDATDVCPTHRVLRMVAAPSVLVQVRLKLRRGDRVVDAVDAAPVRATRTTRWSGYERRRPPTHLPRG